MKTAGFLLNILTVSCAVVAGLCGGCKSASPSHYISPRVEGRVLDAQTHQPVKDVQVRRLTANESYQIEDQPKGGKVMERAPAVLTAADGTFALVSEREFALLRSPTWYSVSISFRRTGYEPFRATYTISESTNTVTGEPLVRTGDVLLIPLAK